VVGGPQYRVGSHRQFTLFARRLAGEGYPTFRFDYRGMGDSAGSPRSFESVEPDIRSAIAAFRDAVPGLNEIVLCGLCDGASAAMMFGTACEHVKGMVILNPWVRSATTFVRTQVKHYYLKRLLQAGFWSKLFTGEFDLARSLNSLTSTLRLARGGAADSSNGFVARMRKGLTHFSGETLLVLSGNDLVAREFADVTAADPDWHEALASPRIRRIDFPAADHTFSRTTWCNSLEKCALDWLASW
jgi:exosortase A-associated hydrolase 1